MNPRRNDSTNWSMAKAIEHEASYAGSSTTSFSAEESPVPECMYPSHELKASLPDLYKTPLTPYDVSFGTMRKVSKATNLGKVAKEEGRKVAINRRNAVSVAFVVRNPG